MRKPIMGMRGRPWCGALGPAAGAAGAEETPGAAGAAALVVVPGRGLLDGMAVAKAARASSRARRPRRWRSIWLRACMCWVGWVMYVLAWIEAVRRVRRLKAVTKASRLSGATRSLLSEWMGWGGGEWARQSIWVVVVCDDGAPWSRRVLRGRSRSPKEGEPQRRREPAFKLHGPPGPCVC